VGISLADEEVKAFSMEAEEVVLVINYDLNKWTWWIPENKLDRVRIQLDDLLNKDVITNGDAPSKWEIGPLSCFGPRRKVVEDTTPGKEI
jgi:hypothetical protein